MTHEQEKASIDPSAKLSIRNLLKFTCPNCGGQRLEELVLMRQEIEGIHDPEDPDYNWELDGDDMVVFKEPWHLYAVPRENNIYRCYDCEAPLTDQHGNEFWEPGRLYRWMKGLPVDEDEEDPGEFVKEHDREEEC